MTAHLSDSVIYNGLASLKSAATTVWLCSSEPASYTDAANAATDSPAGYSLGSKVAGAGNVFPGAIAAGTNGRKVTTLSITDGNVNASGTANYWAITDASNLLAEGPVIAFSNGDQRRQLLACRLRHHRQGKLRCSAPNPSLSAAVHGWRATAALQATRSSLHERALFEGDPQYVRGDDKWDDEVVCAVLRNNPVPSTCRSTRWEHFKILWQRRRYPDVAGYKSLPLGDANAERALDIS